MEAKARGLDRVGGCLTLDGAGFEYTMANFEPYDTAPALRGVLYHNDDEVYQVLRTAHDNDMQCKMHAVGERAIDQLLWTYHRVFGEQGKKDLRHRLEHLCMPTEEQITMAKDLGLILSMQPGFTYEWDEDFAVILGRERGDRIDPFKKVLEAGNIICVGSDCPVTRMTPLTDLAFLVHGRTFKGNTNLCRVVPLTEAIRMLTVNAAYAIGAEASKGSIEVGKDADFSVIDRDPYEYENSDELYEMKPLMTMNKGNVIYSAM
jgi:predicted amidohydrolase YtcJ